MEVWTKFWHGVDERRVLVARIYRNVLFLDPNIEMLFDRNKLPFVRHPFLKALLKFVQ